MNLDTTHTASAAVTCSKCGLPIQSRVHSYEAAEYDDEYHMAVTPGYAHRYSEGPNDGDCVIVAIGERLITGFACQINSGGFEVARRTGPYSLLTLFVVKRSEAKDIRRTPNGIRVQY